MTTTFGASYVWGSSSNTTNKSHGELSLRNDWKLDEPWGLFGILKAEYDEFQRWQWRLSGAFGPSYNFIKNDTTLLKGRVGIGFSYEMGKQAEEKIVPELDIGFDWSHKFNDRTRAFASFDYYPSLDEFPEYRMVGNAGLEVALDPGSGMNLKLGVQDRYDHRAQAPTKKNDVDYFVTLGWTW